MAHGPLDDMVRKAMAELQAAGIPPAYVQLDDWWYPAEAASHDHMCVRELAPNATLFPGGLPALGANTTYLLYAPFWCKDNVYAANFSFVCSPAACDPAPDDAFAFYDMLFALQPDGAAWTNYEVDFLWDQIQWLFLGSVDGADKWLAGMDAAARQHGKHIQYCMAHPGAFMAALAFPAVTNGRASADYILPELNLGQLGKNMLFFSALGTVVPSKDNFWSTDNQPAVRPPPPGMRACDGGAHNNTLAELEALLATLSTGPVGVGDAPGYTNATLVRRATANDGRILKPAKPLTPLDASLFPSYHGPAIWQTHSVIDNVTWHWVLAPQTTAAPVTISAADLWPPVAMPGRFAVRQWGATNATIVNVSDPGTVLMTVPANQSFAYVMASPSLGDTDWVLLGEPDKFVPISAQRLAGLTFNASTVCVTVGPQPAADTVTLELLRLTTGDIRPLTIQSRPLLATTGCF